MKIKSLVFSILLFAGSVFASCDALPVVAQQPKTGRDAGAPQAVMPVLRTEDLLKIRDLQYSQLKRAERMKQIEALYRQLNDEQEADSRRIEEVVRERAKAAGVDVAKWIFDTDALKFVPREKQK